MYKCALWMYASDFANRMFTNSMAYYIVGNIDPIDSCHIEVHI